MKPITLTPAQSRSRRFHRAARLWRACSRRVRAGRDLNREGIYQAYQRMLMVLP